MIGYVEQERLFMNASGIAWRTKKDCLRTTKSIFLSVKTYSIRLGQKCCFIINVMAINMN
jgi:hypothetical protein